MAVINVSKVGFKQELKLALERYKQTEMHEIVKNELDIFCARMLLDAVIRNREGNPKAHQYTGNLINSIVVILFDKLDGVQTNYFASDRLQAPIRKEMTAKTYRGTQRQRRIHFRPDWQGRPESSYLPTVVTDESLGPNDARAFAAAWTPTTKKDFEICVAYTSEYASWVEDHRKSIGYVNSIQYTGKAMADIGFKRM